MKGKEYEIYIKATSSEIDALGHVNNINYLKWVQLIADEHWKNISNVSLDSRIIWVVLRHEIDYFESVLEGDSIRLRTYIGETYGVKSVRFVEMFKGEKLIATSKTIWCLLDKNTQKPIRISKEILNVLYE